MRNQLARYSGAIQRHAPDMTKPRPWRAIQWGGPVLLIVLVHFGIYPGWFWIISITWVSYIARSKVRYYESHGAMREYIRAGGLNQPARPVYLSKDGVRL